MGCVDERYVYPMHPMYLIPHVRGEVCDAQRTYLMTRSGIQEYVYNYQTASTLSGMCQYIRATLDDGTTQSVYVGYK
jgi:hypothetical protein